MNLNGDLLRFIIFSVYNPEIPIIIFGRKLIPINPYSTFICHALLVIFDVLMKLFDISVESIIFTGIVQLGQKTIINPFSPAHSTLSVV